MDVSSAYQRFSRHDTLVVITFSVLLEKIIMHLWVGYSPTVRLACSSEILKQSVSHPNGETLMSRVQRTCIESHGLSKVMGMIVFFHLDDEILRWPVLKGTTINAQYYKRCCKTISDLIFRRNDLDC
ncbi:hypothetical protein ElyMa_005652500 [Elysia marginata]|uniref:Uncharacterized protein n=1 Tax=Elysia marginata TaxID=1093978 RepID=A0AAV4FBD5_9GAST|nr:hypothetical protein ElyMa_005652500 [Elysia marginata]